MASSSIPSSAPSMTYLLYPLPLATYEEVVASPACFRETLEKLHASMITKFKVPTVGGRELDLHRLFVEVTSRGGFMKVLREKKWKEITSVFNFPSSATNASFILRKYYASLLRHYEQLYFFKSKGWSPSSFGTLQTVSVDHSPPDASTGPVMSTPAVQPAIHLAQRDNSVKWSPGASSSSSLTGSAVHGVIDGKFEHGYLTTVYIGSVMCKGVLYEGLSDQPHQMQPHEIIQQNRIIPVNESSSSALASRVVRRRRRKKSEIRRRDPNHPKSNRSGYNFFFAEQHARLKPLYPGKDRDISRIIGDSWNNLNESDRAVYQEKAARDKERYRIEMEGYRQRLRMVQNGSNPAPIQQQPMQMAEASTSQIVKGGDFIDQNGKGKLDAVMMETIAADVIPVQTQPLVSDVNMMNLDKTVQSDHGNSFSTNEDEIGSNTSEKSNLPITSLTQLPKSVQPLELHGKIMDTNNGDERHRDVSIMPDVDAVMTESEDAPHIPDETGNNKAAEKNGDKTSEEAEGGTENAADRMLVGGIEFGLERTKETDEAEDVSIMPVVDAVMTESEDAPHIPDNETGNNKAVEKNGDKTSEEAEGGTEKAADRMLVGGIEFGLVRTKEADEAEDVSIMPVVDAVMTESEDAPHILDNETGNNKAVEKNGDKTSEEAEGGTENTTDKMLVGGIEFRMERTKEADEAEDVSIMPIVGVVMTKSEHAPHIPDNETGKNKAVEKNGDKMSEEAEGGTEKAVDRMLVGGIEFGLERTKEADEAEDVSIMPVVDVVMTKSEHAPHIPDNETDNNKAVEKNGDKTSEEAEGGTEKAADWMLADGIEFGLQGRTKEADEAEDCAGEVALELNKKRDREEEVLAPSQEDKQPSA